MLIELYATRKHVSCHLSRHLFIYSGISYARLFSDSSHLMGFIQKNDEGYLVT